VYAVHRAACSQGGQELLDMVWSHRSKRTIKRMERLSIEHDGDDHGYRRLLRQHGKSFR
jgi:hypothetical protein